MLRKTFLSHNKKNTKNIKKTHKIMAKRNKKDQI